MDPAHSLEAWLRTNGGRIHQDVTIARDDGNGMGYGLRLRKKQQGDFVAVEVPHKLIFSFLQLPRVAPWWPASLIDMLDVVTLTRLALVEAFLQRGESMFAAYIALLPQPGQPMPFSTPLYWDSQARKVIEGTNLSGALELRETSWQGELAHALEIMRNHLPQSQRQRLDVYSWDLYRWAATVLTSRCFSGNLIELRGNSDVSVFAGSQLSQTLKFQKWYRGGAIQFPILLPVMDLSNHDRLARATWNRTGNSVQFIAAATEAGAEIMNNYGQKSNEELIMGYGFSLRNNPENNFGLALISDSIPAVRLIRRIRDRDSGNSSRAMDNVDSMSNGDATPPEVVDGDPLTADAFALRAGEHPLVSAATQPIAIAAANTRELNLFIKDAAAYPIFLSLQQPTRLALAVALQFYHQMTAVYAKIRSHDPDVPDQETIVSKPVLRMAVEYRQNQLEILKDGLGKLQWKLHCWIGSDNVVSLESALNTFGEDQLVRPFRRLIHHTMGTRNHIRLASRNRELQCFVYWLLFLATYVSSADADRSLPDRDPIKRKLFLWLNKLRDAYGSSEKEDLLCTASQIEAERICWPPEQHEEAKRWAQEYCGTLRSSLADEPDFAHLLGNDKDGATLEQRTYWAVRTVREEGQWVPWRMLDPEADEDELALVIVIERPEDMSGAESALVSSEPSVTRSVGLM